MNTQVQPSPAAAAKAPAWRAWTLPVLYVVGWLVLYTQLEPATDAFMRWLSAATGLAATSHLYGDWWSVPLAVLIGVPMYSNAAGIIPVVQALLGKGAALGTTLAFMMAVTALSLPEFMILKKVMKPRLIALFAGVVAVGIIIVGYVFNAVM